MSAHADDDDNAPLSFCSFGPKVTVIRPLSSKKGGDSCATKVHVQALRWKCGSPDEVFATVSSYLEELNREAKEECRKFCEDRGDDCRGIYSPVEHCGISPDRDEAVLLGKKFGCRNDCSTGGKAFTYCSIYNTGYQGPNPDAIRPQKPNCECRSGS